MKRKVSFCSALFSWALLSLLLCLYNVINTDAMTQIKGIWGIVAYFLVSAGFCYLFYLLFAFLTKKTDERDVAPQWYEQLARLAHFPGVVAMFFGLLTALLILVFPPARRGDIRTDFWAMGLFFSLGVVFLYFVPITSENKEEPQPQPPEEKPPSVRAQEILERLMKERIYRGQVSYHQWLPGAKAVVSKDGKSKLLEKNPLLSDTLNELGINVLYSHQGACVESLLAGQSVVLSTPVGSGRSTICALMALDCSLRGPKHVLYVSDDEEQCGKEMAQMQQLLKNAQLDWNVSLLPCLSQDDCRQVSDELPEIIFTTIDALHDFMLPQHATFFENFFANLGLVIVEEATQIPPIRCAHFRFILGRLKAIFARKGASPQFFITCPPISNPKEFASILTGATDIEQIIDDGSLQNGLEMVLWAPPLDRIEPDSFEVERRNYREEAVQIASAFLAEQSIKTLIYSCSVPLTSDEEADLRTAMVNRVREYSPSIGETAGTVVADNLRIISYLDEIHPEELGEFDMAIVTGFSDDYRNLFPSLGHLLKSGGLGIVCVPEEPIAQYLLKNPQRIFSELDYRCVPLRKNRFFFEMHLISMLLELDSEEFVTLEQLEETFGAEIKRELETFIEQQLLRQDKRLVDNSPVDVYYVIDREKLRNQLTSLPIDVATTKFITAKEQATGEMLFYIDMARKTDKLLPGTVLYWHRNRFTVSQQDDAEMLLSPRNRVFSFGSQKDADDISGEIFRTERIFQTEISPIDEISWQEKRKGKGVPFQVSEPMTFSIKEQIFGLWQYTAKESLDDYAQQNFDVPIEREFEAQGMLIQITGTSTKALLTLRQTLKALLPKYLAHCDDFIEIDVPQNIDALLFYERYEEPTGYINALQSIELPEIFDDIYRILVDCPCNNGCACCCKIFGTNTVSPNAQVDKSEAILLLGQLLGKTEDAQFVNSCRQIGIPSTSEGERKIRALRDEIIDVFEHKFGMRFVALAPLHIAEPNELDAGTLGFYRHRSNETDQQVIIKNGLIEKQAIDVIAHEYTHNWEFDPDASALNFSPALQGEGIPYEGKLFLEGFAEWVSYRVLDYFGLKEDMSIKDLREYDEYGEGFEVIKYIEDTEGFAAVMAFVKEGPSGRSLIELYQKSGVWERIQAKAKTS